jgi:mRNA interferase MazF
MISFKRGDIVIVDLGFAAKVRPCVVLSGPRPDRTRNMCVVVPVTHEIRGGECEVPFPKPVWLREASVINVLGVAGVDQAKVQRRLGTLPPEKLDAVLETLCRVVGVESKHLAP